MRHLWQACLRRAGRPSSQQTGGGAAHHNPEHGSASGSGQAGTAGPHPAHAAKSWQKWCSLSGTALGLTTISKHCPRSFIALNVLLSQAETHRSCTGTLTHELPCCRDKAGTRKDGRLLIGLKKVFGVTRGTVSLSGS